MATTPSHKLVTTVMPRYNWIPDSQRKRCVNQACNAKFTTANRRHHCRFCGDIFCSKCLSKHKGHLTCEPCLKKIEGKVILHTSKKERKAKAKVAIHDLKSKISAERTKPSGSQSSGSDTPSTRGGRSAAAAAAPQTRRSSDKAAHTPTAQQKKPSTPKTAELASGFSSPAVGEHHTATFSTAPAPKPDPAELFASPPATTSPESDPFSTGGAADEFDSSDEDLDAGDVAGDITAHMATSSIAATPESDDDKPPRQDDDFAAMLAAADDLQDDGFM